MTEGDVKAGIGRAKHCQCGGTSTHTHMVMGPSLWLEEEFRRDSLLGELEVLEMTEWNMGERIGFGEV